VFVVKYAPTKKKMTFDGLQELVDTFIVHILNKTSKGVVGRNISFDETLILKLSNEWFQRVEAILRDASIQKTMDSSLSKLNLLTFTFACPFCHTKVVYEPTHPPKANFYDLFMVYIKNHSRSSHRCRLLFLLPLLFAKEGYTSHPSKPKTMSPQNFLVAINNDVFSNSGKNILVGIFKKIRDILWEEILQSSGFEQVKPVTVKEAAQIPALILKAKHHTQVVGPTSSSANEIISRVQQRISLITEFCPEFKLTFTPKSSGVMNMCNIDAKTLIQIIKDEIRHK